METLPSTPKTDTPPKFSRLPFYVCIFLGSFLLFLIQPMIGKMILPYWGGTPSIWNTCMFFFQFMLLAGYSYIHSAVSRTGTFKVLFLQVLLLFCAMWFLPFRILEFVPQNTDSFQNMKLFLQLLSVTGIPVLALSCNAPLIQKIFADLFADGDSNPYFLYSASNTGSFLALLSYPLIIEPALPIDSQNRLWFILFACYLLLLAFIGLQIILKGSLRVKEQGAVHDRRDKAVLPARLRLKIILTAFIPSSLMLGVTAHITTDFSPVPLLWILPLALYLLTYIMSFSGNTFFQRPLLSDIIPYFSIIVLLLHFSELSPVNWILIPIHLLFFFLLALLCHNSLYSIRPDTAYLTEYYLCISVGGVMGGLFNSVIAVNLFTSIIEYPVLILLAILFRKNGRDISPKKDFAFAFLFLLAGLSLLGVVKALDVKNAAAVFITLYALPAVACFLTKDHVLRFALFLCTIYILLNSWVLSNSGEELYRSRNFFNVKVVEKSSDGYHLFIHGNTLHGVQCRTDSANHVPGIYYHPDGPLGPIFKAARSVVDIKDVAVIGLGIGAMSHYGSKGEHWKYYEIDPEVIRIALNPDYFSFIRDSSAESKIIQGDGRLCIEKEQEDSQNIIILDAFSSDSIPSHLLTIEALKLYLSKLRPDGVLIFHISNRYLNLEPLLAASAEILNLDFLCCFENPLKESEKNEYRTSANYAVMSNNRKFMNKLKMYPGWLKPLVKKNFKIWTDQHSDMMSVIRWKE